LTGHGQSINLTSSGCLFERNNHRLGPSTAAHFWFNFAAMLTAFSLDPDNNPLEVSVQFAF
jgi:hypothetical protein